MADTLSLDTAVALRHRPRRAGPAHRRRPAARRDRRRRRPARHRRHPRRAAPDRADPVHRPRRRRRLPRPARRAAPRRSGSTSTTTGSTSATSPPSPTTSSPPGPHDRAARPRRDHARPHPRPGRPAQPARPSPPPRRPRPRARGAPGRRQHRLRRRHRSSPAPTTAGCASARPTGSRTATGGPSTTSTATASLDRAAHHAPAGTVTLPADYVAAATELGYATTIHGAQGVSADTIHGLATGERDPPAALHDAHPRRRRQPPLPPGRRRRRPARPSSAPRTSTRRPPPTSSRASSPATTPPSRPPPPLREHADPATRLGAAAARYLDALHVAAEHHLGTAAIAAPRGRRRPDRRPASTDDPAWPTLRAHLILLAATGADPLTALQTAASSRELDTADDRAAVLDWRLDDTALRNAGTGPLPWLPGIPSALRDDPHWGAYLTARSDLVADLAAEVRHQATSTANTPPWWPPGRAAPDAGPARRPRRLAGRERHPRQRPPAHRTHATRQGPRPLAARPRRPAGQQQHRDPGRLDQPHPHPRPRHPPRRLHPAARRAPRRALRRRHRRPHPAPHRHRRAATRRPRRLRPLVAHPTPPAPPRRPWRAHAQRIVSTGGANDEPGPAPRTRGHPRPTPTRQPRTSHQPGPTRPTPRTGNGAMTHRTSATSPNHHGP